MPETLARPARPWALKLLPPFPQVASRVIALVDADDTSDKDLVATIRMDPTFTAELLRVANSALFGATREITTVSAAVARLGLARVRASATLIAVNAMVKPVLRIQELRRCWIHSLVSAILSEEVARLMDCSPGTAYTAGLLHDLGTLGLMAAYPDEYRGLLEVSNQFGFNLIQSERDLFEIDHCAAGACLAEEWNFPGEIVAAIAAHHLVPNRRSGSNIGAAVRISWRLADLLGYVAFPDDREWTYEDLIAVVPGAERSWVGAGVEAAKKEVAAHLQGFAL